MRYLTIKRFSAESGYTEAAVRSKISEGVWLINVVWRRAPDGRVLIDVVGYEAWVEQGPAGERRNKTKPGSPHPLE